MKNDFQAATNDGSSCRQPRQCARIMLLIGVFFLSSLMFVIADEKAKAESNIIAAAVQETIAGEWTAKLDADESDKISLSFNRRGKGKTSVSNSDFSFADLEGLTREQIQSAKADVSFRLVREAGVFECEGAFHSGRGAGEFLFKPNEVFLSEMRNRGFADLTDEEKLAAAMLDVTTKTADDLNRLGFKNLMIDDVFKTTIFKITPELISELRGIGYDNLDLDELVQARIFKITPEFAREVAAAGYERQPMESLVQMRIFKITPDFISEMKAAGLDNLKIDDLVQLKIFKIDAAFVQRAGANGRTKLDVSDLVEMKIYGGKRYED